MTLSAEIIRAIHNGDKYTLIQMIGSEKDKIDDTDEHESSLVHLAVNRCYDLSSDPSEQNTMDKLYSIIEWLLKHGLDVDDVHPFSNITPLYTAVESKNIHLIKLLLEYGADLHMYDNDGNTLLHVACVNDDFESIKLLIDHGMKINQSNYAGIYPIAFTHSAEITSYLLKKGGYINGSKKTFSTYIN